MRSLALKSRRFENTDELVLALTNAVAYWNAHAHPYRWKKRPQELLTVSLDELLPILIEEYNPE